MPAYVYECARHGRVEINKPSDHAGRAESCLRCGQVLRRVFTPQGFVMRPSGWHLRPGDRGYADFRRELELGEVRAGVTTDERRIDASLLQERPAPKVEYTTEQLRDLRNFGEMFDREVRENSLIPDDPNLVRE